MMKKIFLALFFISNLIFSQNISFHQAMMSTAQGYDSNAQAYIKAEKITSETQKRALSNLAYRLKNKSIWTIEVVSLPFLGTYQTHNLKDTSTFKLTYNGTYTLSATGFKPNGTTGYATTTFTPSVNCTSDSHMAIFMGDDNSTEVTGIYDIGCTSAGNKYFALSSQYWNNAALNDQIIGIHADVNVIQDGNYNGNSSGFYCTNRLSGTNYLDKNGIQMFSAADAGALPVTPVYIGALNTSPAAGNFTNREFRYVGLGNGLTSQQRIDYDAIISQFELELGRGFTEYNWMFGDSYTYGAYSGRTRFNTWVYKLDSIFGGKKVFINNGVSGLAMTQHRVSGASLDKTTLPTCGPHDNVLAFCFSTDNDINQALTVSPATNTVAHMDSDITVILKYAHNTKLWSYSKMVCIEDWYVPPVDSALHNPWHRGAMSACTALGIATISHQAYMTTNGGNANVINAGVNDHPSYVAQLRAAINTFNLWVW